MSKFDAIYENLLYMLREETRYIESVLEDYVRLMLAALKSEDLLESPLDEEIERVMSQKGNKKILGIAKEGLPPLKLEMSSPEKDQFKVTVINALDEEDQKTFQSTLSTNCIEDVMAYIKEKQLEELGPDNAVTELPQSQGGEAQLGASGSALPGIAPGAPAAPAAPGAPLV